MYYMVPDSKPSVGDYIEVGEIDPTAPEPSSLALKLGPVSVTGLVAFVALFGVAFIGHKYGYRAKALFGKP